jgi:hypothetical protein
MNKIISGTIGLLLLIGCQNKPSSITQKANSIDSLIIIKEISSKNTIDTKEFANKLLKGLAKVSDDNPTFACMDSLTSNSIQTRDFYWDVFKIILTKSDGALSEVVGAFMIVYIQKFPNEFTKRYSKLNNVLKSKCVDFAAYEYTFSEESETELQLVTQYCKNCKPKEKSIMNKFVEEISAEIIRLKESFEKE